MKKQNHEIDRNFTRLYIDETEISVESGLPAARVTPPGPVAARSAVTGPGRVFRHSEMGTMGFDDSAWRLDEGRNYYVLSRDYDTQHAGAKAPADIRRVCLDLGFAPVDLPVVPVARFDRRNLKRYLLGPLKLLRLIASARATDIVLVQHPIVGRLEKRLIPRLCRRCRTIALIHDLDIIRNQENLEYDDLTFLSHFDVIISQNGKMLEYVAEKIPRAQNVSIDLFDYLTTRDAQVTWSAAPERLYIIGNLNPDKAGYLYAIQGVKLPIWAYGPNCETQKLPAGVAWKGVLDMHNPAFGAVDGFGVVWDGLSADGLEGVWGRYLLYNTPHKLSMYMMLGMPVIVPSESAVARFVVDSGIGFAVESLAEADDLVSSLSADAWARLRQNVLAARRGIMGGGYTRQALRGALAALGAVREDRAS
jgi:hypothetical protein